MLPSSLGQRYETVSRHLFSIDHPVTADTGAPPKPETRPDEPAVYIFKQGLTLHAPRCRR